MRTSIISFDADVARVIFEFNARDRYERSSRSGSWALRALLQQLIDEKLVEDVHQPLRLDARANVVRLLSPLHIQDVVLESQALEDWNIHHACRGTKEYGGVNVWRALRPPPSPKLVWGSHTAYKRNLPNHWSTIMKPGHQTLARLDEHTLQMAVAARHWLHVYMAWRGHGLPEGTRIALAMMSKFVPPCVILKHRPSTMVVARLGNRTWGALGLPLREIHSEDDGGDVVYYGFDPRGEVRWLQITGLRLRGLITRTTRPKAGGRRLSQNFRFWGLLEVHPPRGPREWFGARAAIPLGLGQPGEGKRVVSILEPCPACVGCGVVLPESSLQIPQLRVVRQQSPETSAAP
ncbi:hypothetical protein N9L68_06220 [bacterium]|nr:hypothetical protein [bacterium]